MDGDGGLLMLDEEKCRDYCMKYNLFNLVWFSLSTHSITALFLSLIFVMDPIFSLFQGLDLLKGASFLTEEPEQLETEGLGIIEVEVAGSEGEGSIPALEGSHITFPHVLCPTPTQKMLPHPNCHHLLATPSGA